MTTTATTLHRRRPRAESSSNSPISSLPPDHEEEIHSQRLNASSDTRLLWPLALFHAAHVLDRSDTCWWNSGVFPPATLRLQLHGAPALLTRMMLQTEMLPTAMTRVRHEIRVGLSPDAMRSAGWFEGVVSTKEWIEIPLDCEVQLIDGDNPDTPEHQRRRARFIEIVTHESPSYVAWRRVRIWKRK